MRVRERLRVLVCCVAGAVFGLSACSGAAPSGGASSGMPQMASGHPVNRAMSASIDAASARHLYVSDIQANAILRFPLKGGIPAQTPDAVFGGFLRLRGIAVGPDGRVYAIDRDARTLSVFNPAPTSSSKPVRVLAIRHNDGVGTVGVDRLGRVYVNYTQVCTTEGFDCGMSDIFSPFAQGLKFLKKIAFGGGPGGAVIRSMSFDLSDTLVEESGSQGPAVYADAFGGGGGVYPLFCGATNDSGNVWNAGGQLDETDLGGIQPKSPPQVVVVPNYLVGKISNCPTFYTITSATVPLNNPLAIATNGKFIYVSSSFESQVGSGIVFVLDPAVAGSQVPAAVIDGAASKLHSPFALAVGP